MATNMLYALLSHSWSGLTIAAVVGGVGWLIVRSAARSRWPRARFAGYAVCALGGLLAVGSVVAIVRIGMAQREYPPMGRLVDVGGYRMHILAEGEARGGPTLIWIPGGHGSGLAFYAHHKALRSETRSILFDRPGAGWSDPGPFPRSTAREAQELATLLDKAGERGPFILIGHSYGGLLSANFARRYPERVAAVVLLDATPPDSVIYTPGGGGGLTGLVRIHQLQALSALFGMRFDPYRKLAEQNPAMARILRLYGEVLADVKAQMDARDVSPAPNWATASILSELNPGRALRNAPDLMVYDGELKDIPVFVVVPTSDAATLSAGMDPANAARALNFIERMRLRYLSTSTRSTLIHAPEGTGHNFPYEAPDFVTDVVRRALREARTGH